VEMRAKKWKEMKVWKEAKKEVLKEVEKEEYHLLS
jgi:hypothetical protein